MSANQRARVWERRPQDPDFGSLRLGTGTQQLAVRLVPPQTKPAEDLDPLCAGALRRFIRTHGRVPELPVGMSLRAFSRVAAGGDPDAARGMVRAILAQLAVFHSPEDVRICVCAPPDRMRAWDWAKWLPHTLHATERDAAGPVRLMAGSVQQLEGMLGADLKDRPRFTPGKGGSLPHHVVIVDGAPVRPDDQLGGDGVDGVTLIDVTGDYPGPADAATLRLQVAAGQLAMVTRDRAGADVVSRIGAPDTLSLAEAEALARELAPLRPARGGAPGDDALAVNTTLTALLGIAGPETLDLPGLWRSRPARSRFRVPIGLDAGGQAVELDIKESAQGGMGPHGLVIGATGSGKSELLRTLVLGLALTHPPEVLNFVLVDFKGGATFLGLDSLNHVSAVITNLERGTPPGGPDARRTARRDGPPPGTAPLGGQLRVGRAITSATGNAGATLDPLPTLFVVVDEFSELLAAKPEFIDLFVNDRPAGPLAWACTCCWRRSGWKKAGCAAWTPSCPTGSGCARSPRLESRIVLGAPDAYELPSAPGSGYLKVDVAGMTRFKAAYVSGPAEPEPLPRSAPLRFAATVVPYGPEYISPQDTKPPAAPGPAVADVASAGLTVRETEPPAREDTGPQESLLDRVVRQLAGQGEAARQDLAGAPEPSRPP